jgi:hypothetical protein
MDHTSKMMMIMVFMKMNFIRSMMQGFFRVAQAVSQVAQADSREGQADSREDPVDFQEGQVGLAEASKEEGHQPLHHRHTRHKNRLQRLLLTQAESEDACTDSRISG